MKLQLIAIVLLASACTKGENIFPSYPLSTDLSEIELSNPISIAADPANSQIIVANSNIDF
ncbi:MAG: hypothetical protein Q7T11_01510, partial [Deltaproteobacteria bacterium]|nr:hypothetical protein [Deltaproteobacteria bacterium]